MSDLIVELQGIATCLAIRSESCRGTVIDDNKAIGLDKQVKSIAEAITTIESLQAQVAELEEELKKWKK